jgi:hypothetical protein
MRHGSAIYFLLGGSEKTLDWRGFCIVAQGVYFISPRAGHLTEK